MPSKIQGEGDYESARHYNDETRKFVKDAQAAGKELKGSAKDATKELSPAEREALKHAKHGEQDRRDAEILRRDEAKRQT